MTKTSTSNPDPNDQTGRFVRLLGEHERNLRAYVLSLVPHWADADEIVQQTRVRIWEQFDQYDPSKDFGAWSRSIAYYLVLAMREKAGRYPQLRSEEFLGSVSRQFEQAAPRSGGFRSALAACLQKLDTARRGLIMRFYGGTETMSDIAADMGLSTGTVKVRIHRTRLALADCMKQTMHREGSE